MAIQTYTVPYSELNPAVPYKDEDVKVVLYTDHLAETEGAAKEWEKAAGIAKLFNDDLAKKNVALAAKLEVLQAECREREKAAALSMAEWVLERYMDQKSIGSWEIEAEASHRYGEGRGKA